VTKRQTEAQGENIYHPWAIYIAAREEARCRGDRRVGTEHLLVALLLLQPDLTSILGTDVAAARAGLAGLDRQALAAVGVGEQIEEPVPEPRTGLPRRPTLKAVLQGRLPLTPAAKQALEASWKATRPDRFHLGEKYLLAALLELERPDPAAELLAHLGIDPATAREGLDRA
jgi:hypothetical protein